MKVRNVRHPLTLFYDAACPVCALETDHLRARNAAGLLARVIANCRAGACAVHGAASHPTKEPS